MTFTALSAFAGLLINGDTQGLSRAEIHAAGRYLDGLRFFDLEGEEYFGRCQITGLRGNVQTFTGRA